MAIRYPVRLSRLGRGRPRLMDRPFSSPNPVDWYWEQTIAGSLGYFASRGSAADGQEFREAKLVSVWIGDMKEPLAP
jgi:hypothetical protein